MARYLLLLLLLILAFPARADTATDMRVLIDEMSKEGIYTARLSDIAAEAQIYISDPVKLQSLKSEFEDVRKNAYQARYSLYAYNRSLSAMLIMNISSGDASAIFIDAEMKYRLGRFEECIAILTELDSRMSEDALPYIQDAGVRSEKLREALIRSGLSVSAIDDAETTLHSLTSRDMEKLLTVDNDLGDLDSSLDSYVQINDDILFLKDRNISSFSMGQIAEESKYYIENRIYGHVESLAQRSRALRNLSDIIEQKSARAEYLLAQQDGSPADYLILDEAKDKYLSGEFEVAGRMLDSLISQVEDKKSKEIMLGIASRRMLGADVSGFLAKSVPYLMASAILGSILLAISLPFLRNKLMQVRYGRLKDRKAAVIGQIKQLQEEFFVSKKISKSGYESRLAALQDIVLNLNREIRAAERKVK